MAWTIFVSQYISVSYTHLDVYKRQVQGRIISYGKIGAVQIIVNGAGQSYARHIILLRKDTGSRQGTVSTDNYQSIDVLFLYDQMCIRDSHWDGLCLQR